MPLITPVALFLFLFSIAHSVQSDDHEWDISGFASLSASRLNQDKLKFNDTTEQWNFNSDSVVGLQAHKNLSNRWSFTSQVVANGYNYGESDAYTPDLEWFFVSYEYRHDIQLRTGRLRNPLYYYSTTLEVGYTYDWVRPSVNAYPLFLAPFKHLDGADVTYRAVYGDVDVSYQVLAGRTSGEYEGSKVEAHSIYGANLIVNWENIAFRLNAEQLDISVRVPDFAVLRDGFKAAQAGFAANPTIANAFGDVVEAFEANHQPVTYVSSGLEWSIGNLTLLTEGMYFKSADRNFSNDARGHYVSAAYQINQFAPYLISGEYHNRFSNDIQNKIETTSNSFHLIPSPY